jgi:hypothetical protein
MSVMISYGESFADSGVIMDPSTGHTYQRIDTETDWDAAQAACEVSGGYLATLTSQAENDFVYNSLGVDNWDFWLGATDGGVDVWAWVTDPEEPWSYTNWGTGQPNNYGGPQGCLSFWYREPGKWNDQTAIPPTQDREWGYICEWDEECTLAVDCDDSDACTVDECVNWQCQYSALDCSDPSQCTDDSCDSMSGCVNTCNATDAEDPCCLDPACLGDPVCDTGPCGRSAQASTFGKTSGYGASDLMKHLGYLLLPLGALIVVRVLRRKR